MQTEIKEIGPCKIQIKIEVPAEKIKEKLNEKYSSFISSAVIPGFRKGFAPRELVERKFGKDIKEEFKNDIINSSSADAFKTHNVKPISEPQIDYDKIIVEETKPLSFDVIIEVEPTINLTDYTAIHVKKIIPAEVNDNDINNTIENIRTKHGEWQVLENQVSKKDDMLVFNQETFIDGKRIHQNENTNFIIGSGIKFFGKTSNAIGDALVGVKNGDLKEIDLKVPDDAEKTEYRNKEAKVKITVREVKRLKIPELTEDWAKLIGFDSVKHMKDEIKKRLQKQKEKEVDYKTEEEILDSILAKTDFQLPESMVNENINYLLRRWTLPMLMEGRTEKEVAGEMENMKVKAKDAAVKELKIQFICDHIAKKEKIFVTEDEINQRINELAGQYHKWPNEVRKYYEENHQLGQLRADIREEKVRKFLKEKAVIDT
ncbi:MAG: trigger factor [Planctomycetota bacterium]